MKPRYIHVITPGDHFSPRTGSAIPTVVNGLATACAPRARDAVAVARGTYPDRYDSADVLEYEAVSRRRAHRYLDASISRLGLPRVMARRAYAASVSDQARWKPSVIFGHNAPQLIPSVAVARHQAVLYAHNDLLRTYSKRESGRVLDRATAIIAVSNSLAAQLSAALPPRMVDRLHVVHNGVDTDLFHPLETRVESADLHVVFVGRVLPQKGPDVLIDAVRMLGRKDIQLTIVGAEGFAPDAPLTSYEQSLRVAAQPIVDQVTWEPFRPRREIADVLRRADVAVVPSRWRDPFPLTVLEGMASGAAVIASDIGGIPEATGQADLLVPPGDPQSLAEALEAFADDPSLLRERRRLCLEHAREHDWHASRRLLDQLMSETSDGRGGSAGE